MKMKLGTGSFTVTQLVIGKTKTRIQVSFAYVLYFPLTLKMRKLY